MKLLIGTLIILAGCLSQNGLADDNVVIARDGRSHCVIVLDNEDPPSRTPRR